MTTKKIKKVLIVNRGEIAVRIIKTLRRLHIISVAVFADNDADALFRRLADEAYPLGSGALKDTYLNIDKIINIALDADVDAIHPGYGFLAENPDFAKACSVSNIIFIGPDEDTIRLMGNKIEARNFALHNNIPVAFGVTGDIEQLMSQADTMPYPILIKAAAGGGGKGMHLVHHKDDLREELEKAAREAEKYFGDPTIFVEQYIQNPRHIEVQVLADHHGNVIHLYERECTIQRRHQKIIEESPAQILPDEVRHKMLDTAVEICRKINYKNAGTIEFIVDRDLNFFFLEMNTRIQVEHPITEQRTGIDIVEEQIRIARGKVMGLTQDNITANGHSIEMRIYAENPENGFLPTPGHINAYHEPQQRGIRVDSSIDSPISLPETYDPMIAKLICHGKDRNAALETAQQALQNFIIQGIVTNKTYLWEILKCSDFINNNIDTAFCQTHHEELLNNLNRSHDAICTDDVALAYLLYDLYHKHYQQESKNVWEEIGFWRFNMQIDVVVDEKTIPITIKKAQNGKISASLSDKVFEAEVTQYNDNQLKILLNGKAETIYCSQDDNNITSVNFKGLNFFCYRKDQLNESRDYAHDETIAVEKGLRSPMPGQVVKINVKEGDIVKAGTVLMIVEAMKMENNITTTHPAKIDKICVQEGDMVDNKMTLFELLPIS